MYKIFRYKHVARNMGISMDGEACANGGSSLLDDIGGQGGAE